MDILKFLIIAAVIAIPIIKEVRKNKAKPSGNPPPIPTPKRVNPVEAPKAPKKSERYADTVQASSTTRKAVPTACNPTKEKELDIAIRTAEDIRKGIIWSEILNRKY